ncbi:MAG: 3-methyl-2-oxobutanoate dehydrogenase subunit beta [Candidatus Latescibacterota bacterium]|nr:MAG: 3-methyl-2-oxobutanoate dehydrogenase subunit beta [Candidatus Latescibacterota bacterium]
MNRELITGNEAIGRAAIDANCQFYAGYPITPQNELTAFMAKNMPENQRVFVQAESELAAINMVFGASAAGVRAMTSSSSPGVSLKQEGISYLAGCMLPAVIINVQRGGPGLGNIGPSQSDYFQATRGGGHGDYRTIVLAPSSVAESYTLTYLSFSLAEFYRMPVLILSDAIIGQMAESVSLIKPDIAKYAIKNKEWALTGCKNRKPRVVRSLFLKKGALEQRNLQLQQNYRVIEKEEVRSETFKTQSAEVLIIAYGSMFRLVKEIILQLRRQGKKIGGFRPVTLWPFPYRHLSALVRKNKIKKILVIEMSCGQMLEDVKLSVLDRAKIYFYGRTGGEIPEIKDIISFIKTRKIA